MTASLRPKDWVSFVAAEYLASFVEPGGASIKFPVPMNAETRQELVEALDRLSKETGFLFLQVDALETRVHMVDQVFFRIAEQVPWQELSRTVLATLASAEGFELPERSQVPLFQAIAEKNGLEPDFVRGELRRKLTNKVFKNRELAKDFRVAMMHLCLAELAGGNEGVVTADTLTDWLTGVNKAIGAVKPYQIFNRVTRHNARHFLESLFRWVKFAGYPGTVLIVDLQRLTVAKNPKDEGLYYTKSALLDAYEVLRQFIDGTDRLKSCLLIVVPDVDFLDEDPGTRGMGAYEALKFRVFDEIRDRHLVNPMTSLIRLDNQAVGVEFK